MFTRSRPASFVAITVALGLVLQACLTPNQKPEEAFKSRKLPRTLKRIADQYYELERREKQVLERIEKDKIRKDLLRVAVIDNGVDLAHPDLIDQIEFEVKNGEIVGSGYDAMGNDRVSSANRVDPAFYSFGAKAIEDGRIVEPVEHPLELMADMNKKFMEQLVLKIQADPVLSKSLFNRINIGSATVFGLEALLLRYKDFYKENYEQYQKSDLLINEKNATKLAVTEPNAVVHLVDRPWVMSHETGLPVDNYYPAFDGTNLLQVEHADKFFEMAFKLLADFKAATGFDKMVDTYVEYKVARAEATSGSSRSDRNNMVGELHKALAFKILGYRIKDPIVKVLRTLDEMNIAMNGRNAQTAAPFGGEAQKATINQAIRFIDGLIDIAEKRGSNDPAERDKIEKMKDNLGVLAQQLRYFSKNRGFAGNSKDKMASPYRRYLIRTAHPYVAESSATTSHGSHVSGIIQRQSPDVRIVPVRVSTDGMYLPDATKEALRKAFLKEFREWLMEPAIFRGLGHQLKDLWKDVNFSDESKANREKVAQKAVTTLAKKVELDISGSPLDYVFVEEIIKSIEYVGRERIKIANMSLGMNYNKKIETFPPESGVEQLESLFEFLKFEFFKTKVAKSVQTHAPNTVFVIATGNDGAWIDGRSKSGLPFDVSSPYFSEFEKGGEALPNNRVKNVLAIGSIGPKDILSSFTNIPIASQVPYVFAHGESILSPVRSLDRQGTNQYIGKVLPHLGNLMIIPRIEDPTNEELKRLGLIGDNPTEDQVKRAKYAIGAFNTLNMDFVGQIMDEYKTELFVESGNVRARMSGTSMATPTVAGLLAKMVLQEAKRLGVEPADIYDHPQFKPEVLIDRVIEKGQPISKTARGVSLKKLVGDLAFEDTKETKEVEKKILELKKAGKEFKLTDPVFEAPANGSAIGICKGLVLKGA